MKFKRFLSESLGICETTITLIKKEGDGVILQFDRETRGLWVVDHEDDEYVYFNKSYGFSEVYDFIKAKNLKEAVVKMKKLNKKIAEE